MRLIDADALAAKYMGQPPDYYHTSQIVGEITAAPTVKLVPWVNVKDRLPAMGQICLLYDGKCAVVGKHIANGVWIKPTMTREPTHWMPLQKPPEVSKNG